MPSPSSEKGARGELAWARWLTEHGHVARRGRQYRGGPDSPDVIGGFCHTHVEVKWVETLGTTKLRRALDQAIRDASANDIAYVAHKMNKLPWLVTLQADDLFKFAQYIVRPDQ